MNMKTENKKYIYILWIYMESRTCAKYVRRKGGKGCESRARARERAGESGRERAAPVRKRERDD